MAEAGPVANGAALEVMRTAVLLFAFALAACGQGDTGGTNVAAAAKAPHVASAPAPAAKATPDAACAPAPTLVRPPNRVDPRDEFASQASRFRQLEQRFAAAYRRACDSGFLNGRQLVETGTQQPRQLFVSNAPDSNVVSIYEIGGQDGMPAVTILEYHFVTSEGAVDVPGEAELGEAIYCAVHGASQQEEEESGRCLPD